MGDLLFLAWRYLVRHKGKAATLVVCLTAAMALPMTVRALVGLLEREMVARASATPVVIGAPGSRFDLVLHALYFRTEAPAVVGHGERDAVDASGYAEAIPLFVRHSARGFPIVGTTLDYFAFRDLGVARGQSLAMLGDCVVGHDVARELELEPGDRLVSDPENVFDLAGAYPLNMRVAGVLERANSPDDHAVFVDLKTAWVIEGIGHGHDDLQDADDDAVLERDADGRRVVASPALRTYTEITPENIGTFHFHGDPDDWPLTAIIAVPFDERARALLLGRYVADDAPHQALRPASVIDELVGMVVQLQRFFDVHHLLIVGVTALLVALVMLLSLRLRRREGETMYYLGGGRGTIVILQALELVILLAVSAVLAAAVSWMAVHAARTWVQTLTG